MFKTKNTEMAKEIEKHGVAPMRETINGEVYYSFPLSKAEVAKMIPSFSRRFGVNDYILSSRLHF